MEEDLDLKKHFQLTCKIQSFIGMPESVQFSDDTEIQAWSSNSPTNEHLDRFLNLAFLVVTF